MLTQAHVIQELFPGVIYLVGGFQLLVANFLFAYANVAGVLRRGYYSLAKYALLSPIYWALMSVGAWSGSSSSHAPALLGEDHPRAGAGGAAHGPAPPASPAAPAPVANAGARA